VKNAGRWKVLAEQKGREHGMMEHERDDLGLTVDRLAAAASLLEQAASGWPRGQSAF